LNISTGLAKNLRLVFETLDMKEVIFYIGFCILLINCSSTKAPVVPSEEIDSSSTTHNSAQPIEGYSDSSRIASLNGAWLLTNMPGNDNNWNRVPELTLAVGEGKFSGNTGCNSMSGRFRVNDESMSFDDEIIMTKMACTGAYNEQVFLSNLLRIDNYIINDSSLQLRQLDTVKLVFRRKPI
jgi:heat shock protein HslJ